MVCDSVTGRGSAFGLAGLAAAAMKVAWGKNAPKDVEFQECVIFVIL
jgi:hypothetical protein